MTRTLESLLTWPRRGHVRTWRSRRRGARGKSSPIDCNEEVVRRVRQPPESSSSEFVIHLGKNFDRTRMNDNRVGERHPTEIFIRILHTPSSSEHKDVNRRVRQPPKTSSTEFVIHLKRGKNSSSNGRKFRQTPLRGETREKISSDTYEENERFTRCATSQGRNPGENFVRHV